MRTLAQLEMMFSNKSKILEIHGWWQLLALTALLYLPGTATLPLMDRDEPRFAHATVEMMQRGTWTVPYFNGEFRFDKPPLTYWWMRLHYNLLGVNELAARLHNVVAAWLTALVIAGVTRKITRGSKRAGLIGGVAWLTTLQVLIHGRLSVADMPMVLCVSLACRALLEMISTDRVAKYDRWFWMLWLSLGFGFLAKGPIALLVPALAFVLWRFLLWREPCRISMLPGVLVALAVVAAWGVPALIETQGQFWTVGMGRHVVQRGAEVLNGRKFIPGYYLLSTWLSLFPWSLFAIPVWSTLRARWNAQIAFLAAWFLAPQILFFFYATQLPHYVMPGYPAFIALLALAWTDKEAHGPRSVPKLAIWLPLLLGLIIVMIIVYAWTVHSVMKSPLISALALLAVIFILGSLSAVAAWQQKSPKWKILSCVAALGLVLCMDSLSGQLRRASVSLQVADRLGPLPTAMPLLSCVYAEPSLVFYTDHLWQFAGEVDDAVDLLSKPGAAAVVLLRREWTLDHWFKDSSGSASKDNSASVDAIRTRFADAECFVIEGYNSARSSWCEVTVLKKHP